MRENCPTGKMFFASEREAQAVVFRYFSKSVRCSPWPCRDCGGWHATRRS